MYSKRRLTKISEENEKRLEEQIFNDRNKEWKLLGLPDPFEVVKDFIKEKGLKLYGGKALDFHLKKKKAGIYGKKEFPDYDVYSPNAWEHAKEIARRLYKLGFVFVEAKASVLNDYHHNTFKVGIDALYVLDITQMGCTPREMKNKDCRNCGRTKDNKCVSYFNDLPANDVNYTGKHPRVYRETYDFKTDKGLFPNRFFVCDTDYLKASMFRELTEPFGQPGRLIKVGTRLVKMNKYFETHVRKCPKMRYQKIVKKSLLPVLKTIGEYVKKHKLVNYGASAHNMFVRNKKDIGSLMVSDYKVLTASHDSISKERKKELATKYKKETKGVVSYYTDLLLILREKYPKLHFGVYSRLRLWKGHEDTDNILFVKVDGKVNNLITFTKQESCIPYLTYNGVRYVTIEKLKYLYYETMSTPNFHRQTEDDPLNYGCLLNDLLKAEKMTKKRNRLSYRGKFRKNVTRCVGDTFSKIQENLGLRWRQKMELLKHTKVHPNKPRKGYITKVTKMPEKELYLPYRPEEHKHKKKI